MAAIEIDNRSTSKLISRFFFATELPYGVALMRIALPVILLIDTLRRWSYVREIYSADGAPAALADNYGFPGWLPELPGSVCVGLYTAMIFLLVTSLAGWKTRFSLIVATALYTYFGLMDCMSTITKYTVIATHLLLLLSLSECGAVWSIDSWLRRRQGGTRAEMTLLRSAVWPQRLVQLLLAAVYFGSAATKMHTPAFFSGDQLMYWMMTHINNVHPLGDRLSQYPLVLSIFGYVAIVWEVVFLFTVFQRGMRWWVLAIGAIFHVMTAFTLGLFIFPAVMMASYLTFLTEADIERIVHWPVLRKWAGRLLVTAASSSTDAPTGAATWQPQWMASGVFGMALAAICFSGVELEYRMDHYQQRGPDGPLALRELNPDEAERLFSRDVPMRQIDKLQAFDLGTVTVGQHLFDRRREFRQGEQIIAQMTLSPPHEDLWVDCLLTDATEDVTPEGERITVPGKLLHRVGQIVARESFRSNFMFRLDESVAPGDYFLWLRCGKEEIARRRFTLLPKVSAPHAN
ncbi:MAG: hypothetical protein EXS05_21175 [Planctomycetaceae bacterium]|nr:hypothetical protein [Planctomycetaceae bacterium]